MTYQTALIVDDSKLARITLRKKLEQRGLGVEMAESGIEALEFLASKSVDIVFMDHLMPELDGFETTKKIKANPSTANIPVIMCTGKEYEGYLEEARSIGATNILSKPPENDALDLILSAPAPQVSAPAAADSSIPTTAAPTSAAVPAQASGLSESDVEAIVARLVNDSLKASLSSEVSQTVGAEVGAQQQQKLDQLSDDLTARLNALDGALQNVESKTEQALSSQSSPARDSDELQGTVKALVASEVAQIGPSQLASLVDLGSSDSGIDADQLKATQETVERLTSQMVDMDGRIDELSEKLAAMGESAAIPVVEPIDSNAATAENESLREDIASLKQQLEALHTANTSQANLQSELQAKLDELVQNQAQEQGGGEDLSQNSVQDSTQANETAASALSVVEELKPAVEELKLNVEELKTSVEERLASQDAIIASGDNIPTLEPESGLQQGANFTDSDHPELGNDEDLSFDTRSDLQHQLLGDNNDLKESLGKMKMLAGGGVALAVISLVMQFL